MFNERRKFLKMAGLIGLIPLAGKAQEIETIDFSYDQVRVVQGASNADSTLITILAQRNANLEIEIKGRKEHHSRIFEKTLIDLQLGEFVIHQIFIQDLSLDDEYVLFIYDKSLSKLHKRVFRTLDWNNEKTKIAFLTCANHRDADPKAVMFRQLFDVNPDVIFFAGDLVYGNDAFDTVLGKPADPDKAYYVYTKTLMEFEIYSAEKLIPIFAVWDDHDMALNNAEHDHPNKEIMFKVFRAFFPADIRIKGISQGTGAAFSFEAFGLHVFFFDGRYHKNSRAQQFLGPDQMRWLEKEIKSGTKPALLISSQQYWNYRSLAESFQKNATREFNNFLMLLKEIKRPVFFISGDVHYSQIQELSRQVLGYKTYELTSSAFFSSSARSYGKRSKADGQLEYYGYPNFLVLENIQSQSKVIKMKLTCISERSKKEFVRDLEIRNET